MISHNILTDAELIDEGLEFDSDSLTYALAKRMSELNIQYGFIDDTDYFEQNFGDCSECDDKDAELGLLESQVSELLEVLQSGDLSTINELLRTHDKPKRQDDIN